MEKYKIMWRREREKREREKRVCVLWYLILHCVKFLFMNWAIIININLLENLQFKQQHLVFDGIRRQCTFQTTCVIPSLCLKYPSFLCLPALCFVPINSHNIWEKSLEVKYPVILLSIATIFTCQKKIHHGNTSIKRPSVPDKPEWL